MVTTTGCDPVAAPAGTWKLICVTPTSPGGIPTNGRGASTPPTVTRTASVGRGRPAIGVCGAGAVPVAMVGETAPVPVIYISTAWPRAARLVGTIAPAVSMKMPGAAASTVSTIDTGWPLLTTLSVTGASRRVS